MKIGNKLKQGRNEKSLTQEEVATILNVSRSTISSWEVNRTYPDLEMLVTLSDLYDISLDLMLREDKKMVQTLTDEMNAGRKRNSWLLLLGILYITMLLFSLSVLMNREQLLCLEQFEVFYVGGFDVITVLNLGSLILGVVAWSLPVVNLFKGDKTANPSRLTIVSLGACATSISFQMLYNYVLVGKNDIAALMDTNGFSTIISIILLLGTLLLNSISYYQASKRAVL